MDGTERKAPRLILVSEYYTPANNAPGARFGPLVKALSKHFHVWIYTSKVSAVLKDRFVRCNIIPFPGNSKSLITRLILEILYSMETFVRLLFTKGDIYYLTSPSFFNCVAAAFYCTLFSKRYVVDIRDDYPRIFFDNSLVRENSMLGKILIRVERHIYARAFMVIAATEGLRNTISEKFDGPIFLLRNGFSEERFSPTQDKYKIFTLVFHGNLGYYQDLDLLKNLAGYFHRKKSDIRILVIGKGSEEQKFRNDDLPPNLEYIGSQPHDRIPEIIRRAHVGLSFRRPGKISQDSFPVRAYEYLGVGLPLIVTPISEVGHFAAENGVGYQFFPEELERIANTILRMKEDAELYDLITAKTIALRTNFSRERMSSGFADYLIGKIS